MSPFISALISYLIAFFGGLLPILLWLWFWDHEDKHPEPKKLILLAFCAGMVTTILVIPFETYVKTLLSSSVAGAVNSCGTASCPTIIAWAFIEESFKLIAAWAVVLWRKDNDEPLDSIIYMIAVALGFSALENAIFILPYIVNGQAHTAFIVDAVRFIGATLLHTVSSGAIGIFLALSFYKSQAVKRIYLFAGLITAIILHSLFNLSIILSNESISALPFFAVWMGSIVLLLLFEKVKHIRKRNTY